MEKVEGYLEKIVKNLGKNFLKSPFEGRYCMPLLCLPLVFDEH